MVAQFCVFCFLLAVMMVKCAKGSYILLNKRRKWTVYRAESSFAKATYPLPLLEDWDNVQKVVKGGLKLSTISSWSQCSRKKVTGATGGL